jgi:hypothetical protein
MKGGGTKQDHAAVWARIAGLTEGLTADPNCGA